MSKLYYIGRAKVDTANEIVEGYVNVEDLGYALKQIEKAGGLSEPNENNGIRYLDIIFTGGSSDEDRIIALKEAWKPPADDPYAPKKELTEKEKQDKWSEVVDKKTEELEKKVDEDDVSMDQIPF